MLNPSLIWSGKPSAALLACCLATVLLGAGCSAPRKIDPGFVADRWSMTLRAFNIDPIFLPRQVHLGDVYLAAEPVDNPENDANRWRRRMLYLGRADVRDAIVADTRSRLRLPGSSVATPTDDVFEAPVTTTALRPVAFPGFNVSEIRESDFAAAFPVKLFRALFGLSRSGELVMSINIPRAEYEEVPALAAWKKFADFCWEIGKKPTCSMQNHTFMDLFDNLRLGTDSKTLAPKIGIVTSVYYVRQINYFYNTGRATAFSAAASRAAPANSETAAAASVSAPGPAAGGGPGTTAAAPTAAVTSATSTAPAGPAAPAASATPASAPAPAVVAGPAAAATPAPGVPAAADAGTPAATPGATAATSTATADGPASAANAALPSATTETAALRTQVEAMQKRLDELQKSASDADRYGSLRIVSVTNEGTTLIQTFERPVAIGYRALWIYPIGYKPPPVAALLQR